MDNFWSNQHEYTLIDAAFLWLNQSPQSKIPDSDQRIFSAILNMFYGAIRSGDLEVTGGIKHGLVIQNTWMGTESRQPDKFTGETRVSRESLLTFAEKQGVKSKYFFPTEQLAEECSLENNEMSVEEFVKSMREDVNELWQAIKPGTEKNKSFQAASDFLKKHPDSKILQADLKIDFFSHSEKPKRTIVGAIVQAVLLRKFGKEVGKIKIEGYLKTS